jgi:tetrapyrrole methylase family protein / MazG family protein
LQVVEDLIKHLALLVSAVPFGLFTEEQENVDQLSRLGKIVMDFAGERIRRFAESYRGRGREHDEETREASIPADGSSRRLGNLGSGRARGVGPGRRRLGPGRRRHGRLIVAGPSAAVSDPESLLLGVRGGHESEPSIWENRRCIITYPSGTTMTESPGTRFEALLDVMHRLRGPGGCPWDREQTRTSLKPYLIEECYEVLEAIDEGETPALEEELGDLLFQVVFHAEIAAERGEFTMAALLARLVDKMVSRHPHVFGTANVETPREALAQWERIKGRQAAEAGRPRSVIGGVPRALPALLRAQRLQAKAARVHFDWPDARSAWGKVDEEAREVADAVESGEAPRVREELGDLLFSLVNVARLSGIDAEDALQAANEKFRRRFTDMEADLTGRGGSIAEASAEELERAWDAAKRRDPVGDERRG